MTINSNFNWFGFRCRLVYIQKLQIYVNFCSFLAGTFEPLSSKDISKGILASLAEDDLKNSFSPGSSQNISQVNITASMKNVENKTYLAYYPASPPGIN